MAEITNAQRWMATAGATLVSTYVLDAIAAGTGALLVMSQLMEGTRPGMVLAFLVGSYVAWGAALRPGLQANWALLEQTGTSTSLPSKLAHSLAVARGLSIASCRMAASAGYVGTELAKEAPYYLGAAGAALMTDVVSSNDALIFLAGANLGAAAYEYGLARLVRVLLARSKHDRYASFEADWNPEAYLADYYTTVEPDERETVAFLVEAAKNLPPAPAVLVFGVGPTLHHVFPFAAKASIIDLTDFLPANLREIERWIAADPKVHDWRPFVRHVLGCEGAVVNDVAVFGREALTRARIGRLWPSDLRDPASLLGRQHVYDVVVTAYCADSATDDLGIWALYMRRIADLVRPGGVLVVAALLHSKGYQVGGQLFPSADVGEDDMQAVLARLSSSLRIETRRLPEQARHGYDGILLAHAEVRPAQVAPLRPLSSRASLTAEAVLAGPETGIFAQAIRLDSDMSSASAHWSYDSIEPPVPPNTRGRRHSCRTPLSADPGFPLTDW